MDILKNFENFSNYFNQKDDLKISLHEDIESILFDLCDFDIIPFIKIRENKLMVVIRKGENK